MKTNQNPLSFALVVFAFLFSFGSTQTWAADEVTMQLNWFQLADHSPLYLAIEKGYFQQENIELKILRGNGSGDAAKKIDLKRAEFGMADTPTVLTAISKGADLMIIGVVYDKAANNVFFYKDSGITKPKDLIGKKIAAPPADSHLSLWPAFAEINGFKASQTTIVNIKPQGKQGIVATRRVDASFDLFTNFPTWEKVLGKGNVGNLLWADYGVSLYGHSYIVHKDLVRENPELIRRFLRATHKSWRYAQQDPAASVDAMVSRVAGLNRGALIENMKYSLQLILSERSKKYGIGWIMHDLMQKTIDTTYSGGKMDKMLVAEDVYTNGFNSKIKPVM